MIICMCVVNKQFELLQIVLNFVYVALQYNEMSHAGYGCLCSECSHVVVLGMSVRLS